MKKSATCQAFTRVRGPSAQAKSYEELLDWAYRGEVWGESMLTTLIEAGTFPAERDHLQILLALEGQTRRSLEVLVHAAGLDLDLSDSLAEADAYAYGLAGSGDWEAFMVETRDIAASALPEFEILRDLGPAEAARALTETVEHEKAVLAYSSLRLAGDPDDAVNAVSAHLAAWAPATFGSSQPAPD